MNLKRVALIGLVVVGAAFLLTGCGRHWGPGWGHCGYANGQQYAGYAPANDGYGNHYYSSAARTNN